MKALCLAATALALATVGGCTVAQSQTSVPTTLKTKASASQLEVLHGLMVSNGELTISVASNGCTTAASFKTAIDAESNSISIIRLSPDRCRRRRFVTEVVLPRVDGLKVAELSVENRFVGLLE